MVKFFVSTALLALLAQSGNACFGGLGGSNACCPPASTTCAPSVPKCQSTSYAAPPVPQPSYAAPPLPSYSAPPMPGPSYPSSSGYAQPGVQAYPRPFGVQAPVQTQYQAPVQTQYQAPVQTGYASNAGGYASNIDSGSSSAYVQEKVPSGGSYQQAPGPVGPGPVGPGPVGPGPIPVEPAPQPSVGSESGGEVIQEPGYEATNTPGYHGEAATQPAPVVISTEYGKEEAATPVDVPSYGGVQTTQASGYGGSVQVTSAPSYGGSAQETAAPSYGVSQGVVNSGYGSEVAATTKAVEVEQGYGKEVVTSPPAVPSYGEQLPSTAAPAKGGYGEEAPKGKGGYDQQTENSVTPSQIGAVDYGEETNTSGDGSCEDPELRAIVEAAVNSHTDNLEAARKIEADAGSKFGGRFNSIVSNSEFAYVNWYGKRNCQLRVKERHTLTWED